MERDTREHVERDYHYLVFDLLADSYSEGRITFAALVRMYYEGTGIEPLQAQRDVVLE